MSDELVVQATGLGKRFKLYESPRDRALEWLSAGYYRAHQEFWALRDVSFELRRGESTAVIGDNGAGKSTLLKLLTGSMFPTCGTYEVTGRVHSLLHLNAGFNLGMTGRQNLLRSGRVLNLPASYLAERLPEIEAFAELGEYFDRPVKFYSSGMQARLGFSLFAFLESDVLLLDEVLAVGDVYFRQKCHLRMREIMNQGTSVVFVTHGLGLIPEFFSETTVLDRGRMVFKGPTAEAIDEYHKRQPLPATRPWSSSSSPSAPGAGDVTELPEAPDSDRESEWPAVSAFLDLSGARVRSGPRARCLSVAVCDARQRTCRTFGQGDWVYFYLEFEILEDIGIPIGTLGLLDDRGSLVYGRTTLQQLWPERPSRASRGDRVRMIRAIRLDLAVGEYTVSIGLNAIAPGDYVSADSLSSAEIDALTMPVVGVDRLTALSVTLRAGEGLSLLHHGLCSLPAEDRVFVLPHREGLSDRTVDDDPISDLNMPPAGLAGPSE